MFRFEKAKRARELFAVKGSFSPVDAELTRDGNVLLATSEKYALSAEFCPHSTGVYSRRDRIKNISDEGLTVLSALSRFTFNGGEYEVYTQYSEWTGESKGAWQPLVTEIGGHSESVRCNSGMPYPCRHSYIVIT